MTSLYSSQRLERVNKAKSSKNILQKGFTLVELMVVVAIVGVLSAVALPSFLSQSAKAKGTECTQKAASILKQVSAENVIDPTNADTLGLSLATGETASSKHCTLSYNNIANKVATVDATGKGDLESKYDANICINVDTNKVDLKSVVTNGTSAASAGTVDCTAAAVGDGDDDAG
jgi:type IV pilus assembly protein PilA